MKFFEELDYAYYTWFQEDKSVFPKIFAVSWIICLIVNIFGGNANILTLASVFACGIFGYYLDIITNECKRLIQKKEQQK